MAKVNLGTTTGRLGSSPSPGFFDVIAARQLEQVNQELSHLAGRDVPAATIAASGAAPSRRRRATSAQTRRLVNQLRATGQLGAVDEILKGIQGPQQILNPPRPSPQNPTGEAPEIDDPAFDVRRSIIENALQGGGSERQAALSRALFAATPGNPAPIPTHIQQRQERLDLAVLMGESPEFIQFAQEQLRATQQQATKAVNERNAIAEWARSPHVTDAQRDEAWAKHAQRYPGFQTPEPPKTLAELQMQFRQQQVDQQQQAMDQMTEQLGLPTNPVRMGDDGEFKFMYDIEQMARVQATREAETERTRREQLKLQLGLLEEQIQDEPEFGTPQEQARVRTQNARVQGQANQLVEEFLGGKPDPAAEIDPQTLQLSQRRADQESLPLVVSPEDFESLKPGQIFIDAVDGKKYKK